MIVLLGGGEVDGCGSGAVFGSGANVTLLGDGDFAFFFLKLWVLKADWVVDGGSR